MRNLKSSLKILVKVRKNYSKNKRDLIDYYWYNSLRSKELSQKPIGVTIAETYIVVLRTESGQVAALEDRCTSGNTSLPKARVCRDYLGFPDRGCQYSTNGVMTKVPTLAVTCPIPENLQNKSYH